MTAKGSPASGWLDLGGVTVRGLIVSRLRMGARLPAPPRAAGGPVRAKTDAAGRVELVVRALLVRGPGGLTLVEAGLGGDLDPQSAERHRLSDVRGDLLQALAEAGAAPEEIGRVVLTHAHLDHAGGLGRLMHGDVVPVLPQACVYLQAAQWVAARAGQSGARGFRARDVRLLEQLDLRLLDGEAEIAPGIAVYPTAGHTPGLQVVTITGARDELVYPADLVPTLAQLRAGGLPGVDADPARLVAEKRTLLAATAARGGLLVFGHDPLTAACRLRASELGVAAGERLAI